MGEINNHMKHVMGTHQPTPSPNPNNWNWMFIITWSIITVIAVTLSKLIYNLIF